MKTDTRVLRNVSCPLLFTLQTRYATTSKLQHWRTMQLQAAYRQARRRLASLQGSLVRGSSKQPTSLNGANGPPCGV
ncbi:UNVERIFIED_CONTAM: hypothetical protein FKN15_020240 [Acipenser sinensis]